MPGIIVTIKDEGDGVQRVDIKYGEVEMQLIFQSPDGPIHVRCEETTVFFNESPKADAEP